MSQQRLVELLEAKHHKDVAIRQCNTGSAWQGCKRMDVWVMRTSYARPAFICYEVKSTRQDFLRDHKWREYLDYCTEFYFVVPWAIVDPKELPAEAGLLVATRNYGRLYTKKAAPQRDVTPPVELFMYILMSRARITREYIQEQDPTYWRAWLKEKDEERQLGQLVGCRIAHHVAKLRDTIRTLQYAREQYEDLRKVLVESGVNVDSYQWKDLLQARLQHGLPEGLLRDLHRIQTTLDHGGRELHDVLERLDPKAAGG